MISLINGDQTDSGHSELLIDESGIISYSFMARVLAGYMHVFPSFWEKPEESFCAVESLVNQPIELRH